ncbi:MAG: hypothetical protein R3C59_04615 [Planctomycetaceae bacterium]
MDLPTCPACGQSVLDDDAQECPFCGAAMDGSRPAKTASDAKKAQPPAKPKAESKSRPDDDPFAIAQQPTGQKVLQCAPKPMKGRLTKVVCPMCDTPGFIPKAAAGRQVKCANRECMVPVFTATVPGSDTRPAPKAPARVSEDVAGRPKAGAKSPSEKKPLVLYGIVGAVLLAGTLGLVAFLKKPGTTELGPADMSQFNFSDGDDDPAQTETAPVKENPEPAATDYPARAAELVETMIQTARVNSGNRDKAFCRRLTGDAFRRLGLPDKAEAEFAQMAKVSSKRDTAYYRISPLIADFWKQVAAGDQSAADQHFAAAKALGSEIPKTGSIAVESGIALAAAMVETGDAAGAVTLVEGQQRDATVVSQIDAIRHGVWSATGQMLRDAGQASLSPLEVFAWHEPLFTAVGMELAVRQRWTAATAWASAMTDPLTASDTFAAIAQQMVAANAPAEVQQSLLAASQQSHPAVAARTQSVLAQSADAAAAFEAAKAAVASLSAEKPAAMPGVDDLINGRAPNPADGRLNAEALTDFVIAAIVNKDTAAAESGLPQIFGALSSQIPPTVLLRQACRQLEKDEDGVKDRVAQELSLSNENRIRTSFLAYRRSIDQLAGMAEERRLAMLHLLSRVIDRGGLAAVKQVLESDLSGLKQEVRLDELKGLLFVAAAADGQAYPEITIDDPQLAVPVSRLEPLPEIKIAGVLVQAWQQFLKSSSSTAATQLEAVPELPGLRTSMAAFMTEQSSRKATSVKAQMDAIAALQDDLWREECLPIATRLLTRQGMQDEIQPALIEAARTPTQKEVALYGIVLGLEDLQAAEK